MLPYSDYKKSRCVFEIFALIKSGQATTKEEISQMFEMSPRNVQNYIKELNSEFLTDIHMKPGTNNYIVEQDGIMGLLKRNSPITADDVVLIISSLVQSQSFMETKMAIIKNTLLGLLPEAEGKKLKDMLYFDKTNNFKEQIMEFNVTKLRKAIAEEKKVTFNYVTGSGDHKTYKIIPYSFACEFGKYYIIGKPESKDSLTHLRIDRMGDVRILEEKGKKIDKFNVYDYLKKTWYMYSGPETRVIVKFQNNCKAVVTERNMAEGKILQEDGEYFLYEFICNGTYGIKLWLMGFGRGAEVIEPVELREEIKEEIMGMTKAYGL